MSMSDDEPYDADGDVSRFLHCPSPEAHMFPFSEPEGTPVPVGLCQYAPAATTQVQGQPAPRMLNAAPDSGLQQAPTTEFHGHQAPQTLNAAPDFGIRQAPITEFHGQPAPQTLGLAPEFGHPQAPTTEFHGHSAPQTLITAPDFSLPALAITAEHYQAPAITAEHYQALAITAEHYQAPAINAEHYQAPVINSEHYQAPAINAEQYQAPAIDAEHYQAPTVYAEHYQAPAVNTEHQQSSAMDVDYYQPMAMDNQPVAATDTVQPTQTLAPEMHMHHQPYGFLDHPMPMHCDGDGEASLFQGNNSVIPAPNPSFQQQFLNGGEEGLAAIFNNVGRRRDNDAAGTSGAALDVYPVKEGVVFRPFIRGQLDCTRCHSVREVQVLHPNERQKKHFIVHAAEPGMIFQHAIVDRMSMGADGHFHTDVLLHYDLRRRNREWVFNFIALSVEKLRRNGGQMQDTCPSSSTAVACTNIMGPSSSNHHAHMELEVDMLRNILSAPGPSATTATQPAVTQGQENTHAPGVAETAVVEAAQPTAVTLGQGNTDAPGPAETAVPEAAHLVVTQEQQNIDAPGGAGAAAPQAVQPAVTQEQANTDAPGGAEAAAPQAVQPAVAQNIDAPGGAVFAPFNWEGFQPEILESSQVKPYDTESGVNVLLYPSLLEQLRQSELERKERNRLSKMPAQDMTAYLKMNDDEDSANEPKLGSSAPFKRLCQKDSTYRLYSRRINGLNRKIVKLEQTAPRLDTRGLIAIKHKMDMHKQEKARLYEMIQKAIEENERANNGAGPSNHAGSSNTAAPSNDADTASNNAAGGPSSHAGSSTTAAPSNGAGTASNNGADPSNHAGSSNMAAPSNGAGTTSNYAADPSKAPTPSNVAGISDAAAGPSNAAILPSNDAGPSGSK